MGITLPPPQKGGGPPKFSAHVYCDQTAGWMKLILGMEAGLSSGDFALCVRWGPLSPSPGEFVLDGNPLTSPKSGRAPSPILRVEVENFEIGPGMGALPVIANFVALEQQIMLVKTRSESVQKWRRYNRLNFGALALRVIYCVQCFFRQRRRKR